MSRLHAPQPATTAQHTTAAPAGQNTVKTTLTPKRRRAGAWRTMSTPRSPAASCAPTPAASLTGDVEALTLMTDLADEIDTAIARPSTGLRAFGYSWAEIGSRLGITRQAAQQRWGGQP